MASRVRLPACSARRRSVRSMPCCVRTIRIHDEQLNGRTIFWVRPPFPYFVLPFWCPSVCPSVTASSPDAFKLNEGGGGCPLHCVYPRRKDGFRLIGALTTALA